MIRNQHVLILIICLTGCMVSKQFSLEQTRAAFASTSVKVVVYVPPKADPKSGRNEDVYAWLDRNLLPGWANDSVLWVCDSSEQAIFLAQKRSQALASTNMGDVYGGPSGWAPRSQAEVEVLRAEAFVQLEPHKSIAIVPFGARRFVMRNLVLEVAPMPRDEANQLRAEGLVKRLETIP